MPAQQNTTNHASSPRDSETSQSDGSFICGGVVYSVEPRRVPPPISLPSAGEMRAACAAIGMAVSLSAPASPSPVATEERLREYSRPRSMSCPEMRDYGLWSSGLSAQLNPNEDPADYDDLVVIHGPGLFHSSAGLHNLPGSYSPVQGYGPWPEEFYGSGFFRVPSFQSGSPGWDLPPVLSTPSSPTQQTQQLRPDVPALACPHCELENGESCSYFPFLATYIGTCPDSPSQESESSEDPEDPEDLEDA